MVNICKIKKVFFVEIFGGCVVGVVLSGLDVNCVYVLFIDVGMINYYCSMNNNCFCGGLCGGFCKYIILMIDEVVV